jgi:hypothetical protein
MIDKSEKYKRVFEDVRALYLVVREAQEERGLPLRRAAIRSNGEVAAEAIDFLCDVELKAKRVLPPVEFDMLQLGLEITSGSKSALGEVFLKCKLGVSGDYKSLYFHTKQVMDGQPLNSIEFGKVSDPAPSLEDYDRRTA